MEEADALPSPDSLKGKILVKAKKLPPGKTEEDEVDGDDDSCSDEDEANEAKEGRRKQKQNASKVSQWS